MSSAATIYGVSELELDRVAVTYPGATPVAALRPLSLRINTGEMVGVVGRSGSGKSTLLNVLGLLDRPTGGHYLVQGLDTGTLPELALTSLRASCFGFVFQAFHLLADRTALENAALGLIYRGEPERTRREVAGWALERVGLSNRLQSLPAALSGGERQRVAIARALAQRPRVLLCDEPTGNLDRQNADQVIELLRGLHGEGLTVLIATHDEQIAASMSRVLSIDDGQVIDSWRPAWEMPR
jgi:putative ABC transport system ATP-binding protein